MPAVQPPQQQAEEGAPAWMATYGDMVTLLLCFFVMLYGLSLMEEKKTGAAEEVNPRLQTVLRRISEAFGAAPTVIVQPTHGQDPGRIIPRYESEALIELQAKLAEVGVDAEGSVVEIPNGLKVTLPGELLFDFADAELKENAMATLDKVAEYILQAEVEYDINLLGHTDTVPVIEGAKFKNNLHLSAVRACNVGDYFVEQHGIAARRVFSSGLGEWHPVDPSADNDSEEARARNRRVEILLLEPGYLAGAPEHLRPEEGAAPEEEEPIGPPAASPTGSES